MGLRRLPLHCASWGACHWKADNDSCWRCLQPHLQNHWNYCWRNRASFPFLSFQACEHLDEGDCPVVEGESLVYDMDIPIENFFPTIEITGKWRLLDENGENFLCFTIPMKIEA